MELFTPYVVYSKSGEQLGEYRFIDTIENEGRYRVQKNGKTGFIDATGICVIEPIYEDCSFFIDGYSIFEKYVNGNRFKGIVNINGVEIIPPMFQSIEFDSNSKKYRLGDIFVVEISNMETLDFYTKEQEVKYKEKLKEYYSQQKK
jgi:hypothetical protein